MTLVPVVVVKSIKNVVVHNLARFDGEALSLVGLNLQAVISLKQLPSDLTVQLNTSTDKFDHYSQLLLIGHGGSLLWQNVNRWKESYPSNHPIDDFSKFHVKDFLSKRFSSVDFEIIFPCVKQSFVNFQALGQLAGWHHPSPFGLGINQHWGSWFAYRAVVLLKSRYLTTQIEHSKSPCLSCKNRDCVQTCPAYALSGDKLDLNRCIAYRKQPESKCKDRCIARMACPAAKQHQYRLEQIQYHYGRSMDTINRSLDKEVRVRSL